MPSSGSGGRSVRKPRSLLPAGFVILALALLVATPVAFSHRVAKVRRTFLNPALEARVHFGDFMILFSEHLVIHERATRDSSSWRRHAIVAKAANEAALAIDPDAQPLGPEVVRRLGQFKGALARFNTVDSLTLARPAVARTPVYGREADDVLYAAHAMHDDMVVASELGRRRIQRLERAEWLVTAGVSVLALTAMLLVIRLWRQLRLYAREADAHAEEADAYSEDLARSNVLRATLVHGVVHDVKNPLGAAIGFADLLHEGMEGPLNEKQADMVRRLQRNLAAARQTVAEFVELARVQSAEYQVDCYDVDIVRAIRAIVDGQRARASKRNLSLDFQAPDGVPMVWTDPRGVKHVVDNLLSNAMKYTPAGGSVAIEIATGDSARGQMVSVRVSDNGPGIPKEFHEQIFEPFFRMPGTTQISGTGLGLATSRRIARRLGARLAVSDTSGGGATFTLALPVSGPAQARRPEERPSAAQLKSGRLRRLRSRPG